MKVELKKQSWGERAIVTMDDGSEVEVMRFDSAGTDHKHDVDEIALCISGVGWFYRSGRRYGIAAPAQERIPAGIMHHMESDPDSDEPFEWIIRYE